mgnify:CR=1 FL=1
MSSNLVNIGLDRAPVALCDVEHLCLERCDLIIEADAIGTLIIGDGQRVIAVPGLLHLELGIDSSCIDYACDVVLYTEFDTQASLDAYASHPEHLRVKDEVADLRTARHQVDYTPH